MYYYIFASLDNWMYVYILPSIQRVQCFHSVSYLSGSLCVYQNSTLIIKFCMGLRFTKHLSILIPRMFRVDDVSPAQSGTAIADSQGAEWGCHETREGPGTYQRLAVEAAALASNWR